MVYCAAFGCHNDSKKVKNVSFHRFPKNKNLRKTWIAKLSRENFEISKHTVLCSEHFESTCFERDLGAELLGTKPKSTLKSDAIPTLFCHRPQKKPRMSSVNRRQEKEKTELLHSLLEFPEVACSSCESIETVTETETSHASSSVVSISTEDEMMNVCSNTSAKTTSIEVQVDVSVKKCDQSCQVNTRGQELMFKTVSTQTNATEYTNKSTQTDRSCLHVTEELIHCDEEECISVCSQETAYPDSDVLVSPQKKRLESIVSESTEPELEIESSSDCESCINVPNPQDDMKYLVFEQQLFELFVKCPQCGASVIEKEKTTQGTLLTVELGCIKGHKCIWRSQPMLNRMAAGNLLVSSSILLSGATYTRISYLAEVLNLQFLSEKSFCNIQDNYLFPVINEVWIEEQHNVIAELQEKDVWLCGDGRCDSPGFSAKYGTYSMIDQESDKIIDFKLIQVSEVGNSNQMERKGFKDCMNNLIENNVNVKVVATDGHVGIAADMRKDFPNVVHQQDTWHVSKRITTKLTEKAKKKDCGDLFAWIKSVSNHLWWSSDTCDGNKEILKEKWTSIIYHSVNIHAWDTYDVYHQCSHGPIPIDIARAKKWLRPGSPAHEALKAVVLDRNIIKAVEQLNLCCHTGSLEVYHSVLTSYVPKRLHFSYKGMVACTQLAALHHNNNTGREQAVASRGENEGELRYKLVFPKRTKEWIAKAVKTSTTRNHLRVITDAVMKRKCMPRAERSDGIDTTNIPQNIASQLRPPRKEVIARHSSRFSNK